MSQQIFLDKLVLALWAKKNFLVAKLLEHILVEFELVQV